MSPDTNDLLARIGTAFYDPDALTRQEVDALYASVETLVAEVERLRAELHHYRAAIAKSSPPYDYGTQDERAAVVAWLRSLTVEWTPRTVAYAIERGEHRREGKP